MRKLNILGLFSSEKRLIFGEFDISQEFSSCSLHSLIPIQKQVVMVLSRDMLTLDTAKKTTNHLDAHLSHHRRNIKLSFTSPGDVFLFSEIVLKSTKILFDD